MAGPLWKILRALSAHLRRKGYLRGHDVTLAVNRRADRQNAEKARSFCFVVEGDLRIYCARALAALPDEFIAGIFLHELAHIILDDEEDGDPELQADEWVVENVPEACFAYSDIKYNGRTARAVENVCSEFLEEIGVQ